MLYKQSFVNEILPGLWLGDIRSAHDMVFLKEKRIKVLVNCTDQFESVTHPGFEKYRLAVIDNRDPVQIALMYSSLDHVSDIIGQAIGHGKNVLVHCFAGRQRSFTAIVGYLMKYAKLRYDDAVCLVKTKRKIAGYPTVNFEEALLKYEQDLLKKKPHAKKEPPKEPE